MRAIFGVQRIGHDPVEVAPHVHATNVDLKEALHEYVAAHVPIRSLARRIAQSRSLGRFFEAAPAVAEVLTLQRLEHLLALTDGAVGTRFDPILVDFDATGHALMFLELPRVFDGLVPHGPVRRLLDSFAGLLADSERSRLHLVTLPERLPIQETLELHDRLHREHSVRLGTLFVNRVPFPLLRPGVDAALQDLRHRIGDHHAAAGADLALLAREHERERQARRYLQQLEAIPLPRVELPRIRGPIDLSTLATLGRAAGGNG